MKAKLMIGDKQIEVEIDEQQLKQLEEKKPTGYERASTYYFATNTGITYCVMNGNVFANDHYRIANYYSSEQVASANDRADTLMRRLRRFSVKHRETSIDWNDSCQYKYYISFDHERKQLAVHSCCFTPPCGVVFFDSHKAAEQAIETYCNDLIWYFTEYKDCL